MSTPAIIVNAKQRAGNGQEPDAIRLLSLDLLRGVTIAAMILVNNPGDEAAAYWPLQHAKWNGWTPTDLIFPFFMFIVGVSLVFSFSSRLKRGESREQLMRHVLWRGVILFALGLFINGFPNRFDPSVLRIYGVLQRIAVCYVISAVGVLWSGTWGRVIRIVTGLVGYLLIMRVVAVTGFVVLWQEHRLLTLGTHMTF